jgi:hypothetical protein
VGVAEGEAGSDEKDIALRRGDAVRVCGLMMVVGQAMPEQVRQLKHSPWEDAAAVVGVDVVGVESVGEDGRMDNSKGGTRGLLFRGWQVNSSSDDHAALVQVTKALMRQSGGVVADSGRGSRDCVVHYCCHEDREVDSQDKRRRDNGEVLCAGVEDLVHNLSPERQCLSLGSLSFLLGWLLKRC